MKKIVAVGLLVLLAFSGCFSPWAGNGNLTITWGNSGGGRLYTDTTFSSIAYFIVTLRGPGGTIEEKFDKGSTGNSFKVIPGTWNVSVKGYSLIPVGQQSFTFGLEVMGIEQIEVKPGQGNRETIALYTAAEINEWGDINAQNYTGGAFNGFSTQIALYLINNDLEYNGSTYTTSSDCIFVTEKDVTIRRGSAGQSGSFFNVDTTVTLGLKGMSGTLTLDGKTNSPLWGNVIVSIGNGPTLKMYDGVIIKNSKNGTNCTGVSLGQGAKFYMYGGTITGNDIGVAENSSFGTFIKYGGTVSGNTSGNYNNGTYIK